MENRSDTLSLHLPPPPPLEDGNAWDEEDRFRGFTDGQPPSTVTPAAHQPNCRTEQSQPASTVNSSSNHRCQCTTNSSMHIANVHTVRTKQGANTASIVSVCSPKEATGFADFSMLAEQSAHPWCCGFSPMGSTEQWDGDVGGTHLFSSEHEVIRNSEPRSHCACKVHENGCTKVNYCIEKNAALVQSSQDHFQSQEAAAALDFPTEEPHRVERELITPADRQQRLISCEMQIYRETEGHGVDIAPLCEDVSFEGLEPNISSLASQEDPSDWDQTDVEEEELGDYRHLEPLATQWEAETISHHHYQSATQETAALSHRSSVTHTEDELAGGSFEHHSNDHDQTGLRSLGSLPPSDSFADFCSAPTQEHGEALWAEFRDQSAQEEGKPWTEFRQDVSSRQMDGDTEEEQERTGERVERNSTEASFSCRVQQLLQVSFPSAVVPPVGADKSVPSLGSLLQLQHLPESRKEEETAGNCSRTQWIQRAFSHQDVHSAAALQFKWGGSHTNRTLLRSLGVDTRKIVFIGKKKQPVCVPAFASNLGRTVCSPGLTADTPASRVSKGLSSHSVQEPLPSSQRVWSSRGLSSSQDGTSPR